MSTVDDNVTELVPRNKPEAIWFFDSNSPLKYREGGADEISILLRVAVLPFEDQDHKFLEAILFNPELNITGGRYHPDGRFLRYLGVLRHRKTEYREDEDIMYMEWESSATLFGFTPPYCVKTEQGFGPHGQGSVEYPFTVSVNWSSPPEIRRYIGDKVYVDWDKTRLYLKPWNKEWPLTAEIRIP